MGMMQLLQLTETTEEQDEYICISKTASNALLSVINQILDYSTLEVQRGELVKTTFSLRTMIKDVVNLFAVSAIDKGLLIEFSVADDVQDRLIGDQFKLRQVISQLIGNAVIFTNEGRIDIFISKLPIECNQKIKLYVIVRDTGIGISEDKIDDIFKSFNQADNSNTRRYGGVGLGLSIAQSLLKLMAGGLWVKSIEGKGSDFCFTCILKIAQE